MDKVDELLTRGVDTIYPSKADLEKVLRSGKKLTLYQGFDPTGSQLHLGHMVGFRKLRQWQDLGHHVIFLIGDGTGQAGDPSGKTKSRDTFFTHEQLRQNAKDYVMQASKIVRFSGENPIEIRYNGDWLNKLTLRDILDIAGVFTLQQLIERDLYQERMKKNEPVNMREFLYPLLQGYDSVAMHVDLEVGGSDQTFNMLTGRTLVKAKLNKEKFVMTTPLLEDSQGRKIGKTEGNVIGLTDNPEDLYGKVLALGDDIIVKGFEYLTNVPMDEIHKVEKAVQAGENPMQFKKQLAFEIIKQLHSEHDAKSAQAHFEKTVQQGQLPQEIETIRVTGTETTTLENFLVDNHLASSKSDAKRLIEQGGVNVDDTRITDPNSTPNIADGSLIKIGKRRIVKVQKI
jgi:tyrosyl-tRNA synthetase